MLKLTGCLLIVVCTSLAGVHFASLLRQRTKALRAAYSMLTEISGMIRYSRSTVAEIHSFIASSPEFSAVAAEDCPVLSKDDRQIIASALGALGSSDTEGQLAMLSLSLDRIGRAAGEAAADEKEKCRLYTVLGFMSGAFAAILLI